MWFKKSKGKNGRNVYLLIDRSGSMAREWNTTLESINGYVEKLEDDVNVYIAAFDSVNNGTGWYNNTGVLDLKVLRMTTAKSFEKITNEEISPRGGTPLYDAAGKVIDQMIADNPDRAVLVIMTDGEENCSKVITHAHLMTKLQLLETKKWPVVYLGAGFKEVAQYATQTFGIHDSYTFNTTGATRGMAMNSLAEKTETYFNEVNLATATATMSFSDEEKAQFEETDKQDADQVGTKTS